MDADKLLKDLVTGVGCLCEVTGLMRTNLMRNGFTREEATQISKEFLFEMLKGDSGKEK